MSPSPSPPEFFVDRSLGRHRVADALRAAGWILRTHAEVFADRDETVPDVEWLEYCGREGLVVLTKDRKLRYRRREIAAIRRHRVRAFVLTRGNLRAAEQARRFIGNAAPIAAACEAPGPFVYAVHDRRIERLFPDQLRLPRGVREALRRSLADRERAESARAAAGLSTAQAVRTLLEELHLSVRDAGELLGLSHQRVQQLVRR